MMKKLTEEEKEKYRKLAARMSNTGQNPEAQKERQRVKDMEAAKEQQTAIKDQC
jgi:hypothetical protein